MTTQSADTYLLKLSNVQLERGLLHALVTFPDDLKLVDLEPDDFHDHRNRTIFTAMRQMAARNIGIDYETMENHLIGMKQYDAAGGFDYLADVFNNQVGFVTARPVEYAVELQELATRRRAFREGQDFLRQIMDRSKPVNDTINTFSARIPKLVKVKGGAQNISVYASQHYDRLSEAHQHPEEAQKRVMKTGMLDFDDATVGGLRNGELLLLIGKPGFGKTKWMHQIGAQLAGNGYAGAIYQCETSQEEIMDREFSRETQIPTERLETATLLDEEWPLYTHAFEKMCNNPNLFLDFSGSWNTVTLRADLTRMKAEHNIRWFAVDYLKFLRDNYGASETERENYISIQLKQICRDLDIAGIVIHSMNKSGMASEAPELEHSSGGAGIGYDCDKALFMMEHVPEDENAPRYEHYRTFVFRKSRRKLKKAVFHMQAMKDYPFFGAVEKVEKKDDDDGNTRKPPSYASSNGKARTYNGQTRR